MGHRVSRRKALTLGATAAALPLVHIRTAGAAGKLSVAFWDHWVPDGTPTMRTVVAEWAEKNKVDVQADFLTSIGNKINITMAAEAQSKTGHDIYSFDQWTMQEFADSVIPLDDIMGRLIGKYGKVAPAAEYLGKVGGKWMGVPTGWGASPLTPCGRMSLIKQQAGYDVTKWFPNAPATPETSAEWTYEAQLKLAEAGHKAGFPIGLGCGGGATTDANQTWGATFGAFGADLVDSKGNITVDSDNVMAAMEYCKKLIQFMSPDAISWDDASNNRALISGKTTLIWNPPSAWAVALRDNPALASDCWTFPNPRGPKGRLVPYRAYFWGIWKFAKNQGAARDLIEYLSQREQVERLAKPVSGYDISAFLSMSDMKIWEEVGPPKGTIYNYPIRPWHDASYYVPGSAAPPEIAVQLWNNSITPGLVSRMMAGQTIKQSLDWAKREIEGFRR